MTAAVTPTRPSSTPVPPARTPDSRRKFQLTEFGGNHNKWWQVEVWDLGGGTVHMRTTWGRVGATPQSKDRLCGEVEVQRTIQDKKAKGYQELDLHTPRVGTPAALPAGGGPAATPDLPRKVVELLDLIFKEAGERIASYLAVAVDALSQAQIRRARDLLGQAARRYQIWQQSRSRADFATLASQQSTDPGSKDKGGDLGWFGRAVMDPPFETAAFALQPGQLSDVVHGANGFHVIQLLERDPARAIPADQLTSQRQKAFTDWLASRRSSQDVKLQMSQAARDWILARIGIRP